ncbi:MAG: hypothetical protein JO113_00635 [Candidatus Eremiobacteraeota bacterium]|nr:hypothetical protein [Candidatus Eremiobacteraeota bacterium]
MMRRLLIAFSAISSALIFAACSNGAGTTPNLPTSTAGSKLERSLRHIPTPPHPPPIRHKVTGADRARALAGGWTPVQGVPSFPNGPQTEELLTDGGVLIFDVCASNVYKLSPDQNGNYATGSWTQLASLPSGYAPLYFASAVLPDGKLIVNGGEYNFCNGAETTLGAIYDPVANTWASVSPPSGWSEIGDAQSVVLNNGTYMIGNCCTSTQAQLNESNMTWTQVGSGKEDPNSEEGWTLLKNGNVLSADVLAQPKAEYFSPTAIAWEPAGSTPDTLVTGEEIGPQTLRPDGTVWVAGATGFSAIYNSKTGGWTDGPTFPVINGSQVDVADGPSSLLPSGKVLIAGSPGLYQTPASFYLYNGSTLKAIPGPPNEMNDSSYNIRLLLLPNGQVLEADGSLDVEVYTPRGRTDYSSRPRITSVPTTLTHGTTYTLKGRLLNGVSQDNMYGDDVQQATNYPLVRITNGSTGHVFYCRTHDHSFMGVNDRKKKVTTMFDVPSSIETGAGTLQVVTNGIASAPVSVTVQ